MAINLSGKRESFPDIHYEGGLPVLDRAVRRSKIRWYRTVKELPLDEGCDLLDREIKYGRSDAFHIPRHDGSKEKKEDG